MRILSRLVLIVALCGVVASCGTLAPTPTRPAPPPAPTRTAAPTVTPPPTATRPPAASTRPTSAPTAVPEATVPGTAAPTAEPTTAPQPTAAATAPPAATATPELVLTALSALPSLEGQEVTVQANIVWISSFSAGFKFLLDDGTGRATLLLWTRVYQDCWAASKLLYGATVQVHGVVGQYEGEWQISPDFGGDVKALAAGGLPALRQVSSLTAGDAGSAVAVEGTVARAEAFSQGQRVYIDDGTGELLVLLWQNVYDLIPDKDLLLAPGTRVRAGGIVEEYQGTLELVPQVPYSVRVNP